MTWPLPQLSSDDGRLPAATAQYRSDDVASMPVLFFSFCASLWWWWRIEFSTFGRPVNCHNFRAHVHPTFML